ncbi:MAG: hypothetical protein ACT6VC_23060, partial [Bosea sp. (in: a-proteobacteria)]
MTLHKVSLTLHRVSLTLHKVSLTMHRVSLMDVTQADYAACCLLLVGSVKIVKHHEEAEKFC